jgi:cytochrome c-type biogenesis protein CcmH/NrfF
MLGSRGALLRLVLLAMAVTMLAGAGDDNARFNDLGHRMMCVCGCNQILLECNHVGCKYSDRMRGELSASLDRGDSEDLTLQSFVQKYGTTVLAAPTKQGFNRVAWIIPYAVLLLGLLATMLIVRAWRGRQTVPAAPSLADNATMELYRRQARQETEL